MLDVDFFQGLCAYLAARPAAHFKWCARPSPGAGCGGRSCRQRARRELLASCQPESPGRARVCACLCAGLQAFDGREGGREGGREKDSEIARERENERKSERERVCVYLWERDRREGEQDT